MMEKKNLPSSLLTLSKRIYLRTESVVYFFSMLVCIIRDSFGISTPTEDVTHALDLTKQKFRVKRLELLCGILIFNFWERAWILIKFISFPLDVLIGLIKFKIYVYWFYDWFIYGGCLNMLYNIWNVSYLVHFNKFWHVFKKTIWFFFSIRSAYNTRLIFRHGLFYYSNINVYKNYVGVMKTSFCKKTVLKSLIKKMTKFTKICHITYILTCIIYLNFLYIKSVKEPVNLCLKFYRNC